MKVAIWCVFGLMALMWTAGALLVAELAGAAAQALASGEGVELAKGVAQWPVPEWISLWLDPAWIRAAQQALLRALEALTDSPSLLGSAAGWLVPLVWLLWALGLGLMLLLAIAAHVLLSHMLPVTRRSS